MATHSSILAWKIPWVEEPGRLQSIGSQRVGHDWVASLHFTLLHALVSSRCGTQRQSRQLHNKCQNEGKPRVGMGWPAKNRGVRGQLRWTAEGTGISIRVRAQKSSQDRWCLSWDLKAEQRFSFLLSIHPSIHPSIVNWLTHIHRLDGFE